MNTKTILTVTVAILVWAGCARFALHYQDKDRQIDIEGTHTNTVNETNQKTEAVTGPGSMERKTESRSAKEADKFRRQAQALRAERYVETDALVIVEYQLDAELANLIAYAAERGDRAQVKALAKERLALCLDRSQG